MPPKPSSPVSPTLVAACLTLVIIVAVLAVVSVNKSKDIAASSTPTPTAAATAKPATPTTGATATSTPAAVSGPNLDSSLAQVDADLSGTETTSGNADNAPADSDTTP